jgi:hypothetical protein
MNRTLTALFHQLNKETLPEVMPLTTEEMKVVGGAYSEALTASLARFPDVESRKIILEFCEEVIYTTDPTIMFVPDSLNHFRDRVYRDPVIKKFIDTLITVFYTYWGDSGIKNTNLAYNLTVAFTSDFTNQYSVIPKQIGERSNPMAETLKVLSASKMMMVLTLLKVYGQVGKESKQRPSS